MGNQFANKKKVSPINFIFFPLPIQISILQFFSEKELLEFFPRLSREMKKICQENDLWKLFVKRKFSKDQIDEVLLFYPETIPWKSVYMSLHTLQKSTILTTITMRLMVNQLFDKLSQQWRLLYRGTRDGFEGESFHQNCDDHFGTLIVVQSDNGSVFGGYTKKKWHGYSSYSCDVENTFLFRLRDSKGNLEGNKILNSGKFKRSIYGHPKKGPIFGFGPDLYIENKSDENEDSHSRLGSSFAMPGLTESERFKFLAGKEKFKVSEIEVWQKIEFHHSKKK